MKVNETCEKSERPVKGKNVIRLESTESRMFTWIFNARPEGKISPAKFGDRILRRNFYRAECYCALAM